MKNLDLTGDVVTNDTWHEKIELVNCPHHCANCKLFIFEINRLFYESEQYQIDQEYQFSVNSLKKAFEKTYEFVEPEGQECAGLFRVTITESLEKIHQELKRMTKGFYRRGRYKKSIMMSEETLKEFKQIIASEEEDKKKDSSAPSKDKQINLPAV